jgi:SAM-dependent methyltransferase
MPQIMSPNAIQYRTSDLEILAELEQRHFWFRARRRILIDALARWFPGGTRYLEIGCGTGYVARGIAQAFPTWEITTSDALASDGNHQRIDACNIPFHGAFDIIGAYDVLEHIADDRAALQQVREACSIGGGVLLTVPQHPWLWSSADEYAQHERRYKKSDLLDKLREAGFEILGYTSFHTMNLPLFVGRSLWYRARPYSAETSIPPIPVNWLLERSMELDRWIIQCGARLPLGVSLLVAARRTD